MHAASTERGPFILRQITAHGAGHRDLRRGNEREGGPSIDSLGRRDLARHGGSEFIGGRRFGLLTRAGVLHGPFLALLFLLLLARKITLPFVALIIRLGHKLSMETKARRPEMAGSIDSGANQILVTLIAWGPF